MRPLRLAPVFQVLQRLADDAGRVANQHQRAVGDFARQFQGTGAGRCHEHRNPLASVAAGEVQPIGHTVEIHRLAGQQRLDLDDAPAHLTQRGRASSDGAGRGVTGADDELGAARRNLGNRLGSAGQHSGDAAEGIGYRREQV